MACSEEKKAQAVAALLAGVTVGEVSQRYGIPKATVSRFKSGIAEYLEKHATQDQRNRIGEMLLSLLKANMQGLGSIAENATTTEVLAGQDVRAWVALYGAIGDLTVRLLYVAMEAGIFPEWNKMERFGPSGPSTRSEISA